MSLINVVRAAFEKKQAAAAAEAAAGAHDYSSARCTQPPARPSDGVVCGAGGCACLGRPAGNPPLAGQECCHGWALRRAYASQCDAGSGNMKSQGCSL